ncbi:ABC transporter substrate-binding protein [Gymnodinialimonas sp. 2305UL16-5]|uniref:ABC transporter substrate-binding protein n=1 Tax=Gymnodinialimonas mytili TaxID=3126503 RepID=UPI0030AAD04D
MRSRLSALAISVALWPMAASADTADGDQLIAMDWDEIVALARGGEVNWFMWGGSDAINQYVSGYIGGILEEDYGITLNRVGISDTVEAVNIVLGEREAGNLDNGSVDLIWINGENFRTMVQGDLAYCGYPDLLPNNALIDWDNPAIANDFGVPVNGCEIPWNTAQFAFAYNTALHSAPPLAIPELLEWIEANPGQFTYPAPPDFNGSVFVRHVFYHAAGGVENLLGAFDQAVFDEAAAATWEILNGLEPYLWRDGATYPASMSALEQLYANQEVGIIFNYDPATVGVNILNGTFPPTTQGYALTDGTIGNTNYTLVPFNSPNKAAALVLQNVLLSAEAQLEKLRPEIWGAAPGIDVTRLEGEMAEAFDAIETHPNVAPAEDLAANALPELQAEWIAAIEQGWIENVGSN